MKTFWPILRYDIRISCYFTTIGEGIRTYNHLTPFLIFLKLLANSQFVSRQVLSLLLPLSCSIFVCLIFFLCLFFCLHLFCCMLLCLILCLFFSATLSLPVSPSLSRHFLSVSLSVFLTISVSFSVSFSFSASRFHVLSLYISL